ncbi:MAG TPA: S24 family peptidase [Rhodocyclaceae bacterium]|nr:S24 family peptidase [Rhodocyclaceae bacterium]
MDLRDILNHNLWYAIRRFGSYDALAEAAGAGSRKYFEQILKGFQGKRDKHPRKLGPSVAASIEKALGVSAGWMHQPHPELWERPDDRDIDHDESCIKNMLCEPTTLFHVRNAEQLPSPTRVANPGDVQQHGVIARSPGGLHEIPILTYGDILEGTHMHLERVARDRESVQLSDSKLGSECFAVELLDNSMAGGEKPLYKGQIIVIAPPRPPRHTDIVLIMEPGAKPMIRQYWEEGVDTLARATAGNLPPRRLDCTHIVGVARRAVTNLDDSD